MYECMLAGEFWDFEATHFRVAQFEKLWYRGLGWQVCELGTKYMGLSGCRSGECVTGAKCVYIFKNNKMQRWINLSSF